MPTKIVDKEGKEHEFLTQEEIDAKVNEAVSAKETELTASISERDEKITKIENDLKVANEALGNKDQGTKDWAAVRKQVTDLENLLKQEKEGREKDKSDFANQIRDTRTSIFKDQVEEMITNLAGDNKELKEKIEFRYKSLGDAKDVTDAKEKLQDAFLLATGKQAPNSLNVARNPGGGMPPKVNEPASEEVSELGRKFGLSDEDIKKYGEKANAKKQ